MKLILVDERHGHTKTIVLKGWLKGLLTLVLIVAPVALVYFGYQIAVSQNARIFTVETAQSWDRQIKIQAEQLEEIKEDSERQLEALTLRLAMLQARLESQLKDRTQQLEILEGMMADRKIQSDVFIAGRPVERGWIASRFGQRPDPFTGRLTFHAGVDFTTGRYGENINTVAAGVVTWSGPRSRYGLMVEVNHGNGFTTRYSHAEKLFVEVGDIVKKGQNIALVGSTGRSTGPHVHFEVYKNGRVVDPAAYIHRTAR